MFKKFFRAITKPFKKSLDWMRWKLEVVDPEPIRRFRIRDVVYNWCKGKLKSLLAKKPPIPVFRPSPAEFNIQPDIPESNDQSIIPEPEDQSDLWFTRLGKETHPFIERFKAKEVRVVILDTGVDLNHPMLKARISTTDCWDFVKDKPTIFDEVGHGTHTASVLARTAPRARIFCGRVAINLYDRKSIGEIVSKAIHHAVGKWRPHIIVMPFGFPDSADKLTESAIDRWSKEVLFVSSAPSNNDHSCEFPASHSRVLSAYCYESVSTQSELSSHGKGGEKSVSVWGLNVEGACLYDQEVDQGVVQVRRETEFSCSATIVAGVAALILEFVKSRNQGTKKVEAKKLKKQKVMEQILYECMTDQNSSGGSNLIEPWKLLGVDSGKEEEAVINLIKTYVK